MKNKNNIIIFQILIILLSTNVYSFPFETKEEFMKDITYVTNINGINIEIIDYPKHIQELDGKKSWGEINIRLKKKYKQYTGTNERVRLSYVVDLNNDGIEEIIFKTWSGGNHCCYKLLIFDQKTFLFNTIDIGGVLNYYTRSQNKVVNTLLTNSYYEIKDLNL